MRHAKGYRRLNRTHEHRKALFSNMAGSLIEHEQIKTTLPKAKELKRVMDKLDLQLDAEIVYLEDLRDKLGKWDQITSAIAAFAVPAGMLTKSLGLHNENPSDTQTVIFTSGSTGVPKGVMLSYSNVRSNVDAINQLLSARVGEPGVAHVDLIIAVDIAQQRRRERVALDAGHALPPFPDVQRADPIPDLKRL